VIFLKNVKENIKLADKGLGSIKNNSIYKKLYLLPLTYATVDLKRSLFFNSLSLINYNNNFPIYFPENKGLLCCYFC